MDMDVFGIISCLLGLKSSLSGVIGDILKRIFMKTFLNFIWRLVGVNF